MDPVTVSAAVSGAVSAGSHLLTLLRGAAESAKALGKAEIVDKLIEVQLAMMELLEKQQALIDENRFLHQKNTELEETLALKPTLEIHDEVYLKRLDDGKVDGPFCSKCWDTEFKLVRLHSTAERTLKRCPNCNTTARYQNSP